MDEAVVWDRWVLQAPDPLYAPGNDSRWTEGSGDGGQPAAAVPAVNQKLIAWGLPMDVAQDALNPGKLRSPGAEASASRSRNLICRCPALPCAGFADPFPPTIVTLDNPTYRVLGLSFMKGKLDWVLLRRLAVHETAVGNHQYQHSDHKWLSAIVSLQLPRRKR